MRNVLIIVFLLMGGFIYSQNQTPIEDSIEESELDVESVKISTKTKKDTSTGSATVAKKKLKKEEQFKAGKSSSTTSAAEKQKFKLYKSAASVQRTQRSPSVAQQSKMDEAVTNLEEVAPNSFEFHYFKYVAGNYNTVLVAHLNEAEKLRPKNVDILIQKTAYNIIIDNKVAAISYLKRVYSSGKLSKDVVNYAEDILLSVPKNGTLITHGFDDFYGTYYAQSVKKIRSDVKIISLELLQSETYRKNLKKGGYTIKSSKVVDIQYLKKLCSENSAKNISVSITTPKEYLRPIAKKLFLSGLVMMYSNSPKENFNRNVHLWNYGLKKHLIKNAVNEKSKQLSANYLPMLFILRKGYNSIGATKKVKEIDKVIDAISVQSRKYEKAQKLKASY